MQLLAENPQQVDMIFAEPPYYLSKGFTMRSKGRVKCFDKGEWDREHPLHLMRLTTKLWGNNVVLPLWRCVSLQRLNFEKWV